MFVGRAAIVATTVIVAGMSVLVSGPAALAARRPKPASSPSPPSSPTPSPSYTFTRSLDPEGTRVTDASGAWVATFTDGARTVALKGPARTFNERTAAYPVTTNVWVRLLPAPFDGTVDTAWLNATLTDVSPDVLAVAMGYIEGAPAVHDASGLRIAGDASFGPVQADGTRQEGSDFNDYLGVTWSYPEMTDDPETHQYGAMDCSGFMRMVWGYRSGVPLTYDTSGGAGLPRRSYQMYDSAPGVVTITNEGTQVTSFGGLQAGDLVFFDASTDDGTQIDHVGMYLGRDTDGNHRFISSRKSIDGPTLGDYNGRSVLNGTGLYARSFRAARRL